MKKFRKLENKTKKFLKHILKKSTCQNNINNANIKYTACTYYTNLTQKLTKLLKDKNLSMS